MGNYQECAGMGHRYSVHDYTSTTAQSGALSRDTGQHTHQQKRTSVNKWHKVLVELRSMAIALPGARHLFSHMQYALSNKLKTRVTLSRGVYDALEEFRWILNDLKCRPTRIAELVPLLAAVEGHHDASGKGA